MKRKSMSKLLNIRPENKRQMYRCMAVSPPKVLCLTFIITTFGKLHAGQLQ